jgi:hypothetical protein
MRPRGEIAGRLPSALGRGNCPDLEQRPVADKAARLLPADIDNPPELHVAEAARIWQV